MPEEELPPVDYVYRQVAATIRERIKNGTYPPRSRLPAREQLAEELGVATMTVRRAMGLLQDEGYVRILHGSGTWVTWEP